MKKVIRDGNVAVLISPGWGAGWYTWNKDHVDLLFHPLLVEMVENGNKSKIDEDWIKLNLGIDHVYTGGAEDLVIKWIPIGTMFTIYDYDGWEQLLTKEDLNIIA